MSEFWIFFEKGMRHILNPYDYHHVLFLIALTVPFIFKDWIKLLLLATVFTIAHTVALLLSVFGIIIIKANLVEFLIPITILIVAVFHLFTAGKSSKNGSISVILFITLFFGIIHGFTFSHSFNGLLKGSIKSKLLPISEFAIGMETAQIIVILVVLILSYIVQTFFRFSKRDWALVMSAFIIGVVLPMVIQCEIWNR